MFLRHFLFYLFILLENFQSYDEKQCCLFIPKNIFCSLAAFIEHFFLDARAPGAIAEHRLSLYMIIKHNLNFYHRTCGTGKKSSFEVCMLFCFNIRRSITFIMYNFSLGFSMYIFILQAHDDVILKQFIDLETLHYFGLYIAVVEEAPVFSC